MLDTPPAAAFLDGGGEAARMIRARDWSTHPLGPPETWDDALRSALSLVLNSPESMILAWGPDLHFFFNDAYFPLLGPRLDWAMGARFAEVWADALDQAMPIIADAMAGRPQRFIDLPWKLATDRGAADTWWSFSYSRVLAADGSIAGLFILTSETTQAVLDAARVRATQARQDVLLALEQDLRSNATTADILLAAAATLGHHLGVDQIGYADIDAGATTATIEHEWTASGVASNRGVHPLDVFGAAFAAEIRSGQTVVVQDIASDPRTRPGESAFAARGLGAVIDVPILKDGRLRAVLAIHSRVARAWTADEIALAEDVADRLWSAIERARAETALRDLNATLASQVAAQARELAGLWRTSRDPFLVSDLEGRWLRASPAWTDLLGWSEADLIGRTSEWMEHPDDRSETRGMVEELAGGEVVRNFVNRFRTREGAYRWFSWSAVADDARLYCVARDITAERVLAGERALLEEQLRQSQKLEAIGQLTGGVAHDFNNLLTVITGSVDLLNRPDLPEAKRQRYVSAIGDTAARAAKLTSQLLAFARRQALKPEPFDIGTSLREIGDMIGTLIGSQVTLELTAPNAPVPVLADRSQLDTAIVNMAINARDAMGGIGRLSITAEPVAGIPAIRSHPPVAGDFVAVTVQDSGAGIEPAQLDMIFEPFFTTKPIGAGTGLGLSQVIGFAKQSGGDVRVTSAPGAGATFTLYLPQAGRDALGEPDGDTDTAADGEGRCVLVVEDNDAVGAFAAEALSDLGYDAVRTTAAEEALALLAEQPDRFHIVFSDVVMPGIGGIELAEHIHRRYPSLPVVLTSGFSHVLAQNGKHGFELLHKPYSVEQLSRMLRKAIRSHRAAA